MCNEFEHFFLNLPDDMREAKQETALKGKAEKGIEWKEKALLWDWKKNGSSDIAARSENQLSDRTVLMRQQRSKMQPSFGWKIVSYFQAKMSLTQSDCLSLFHSRSFILPSSQTWHSRNLERLKKQLRIDRSSCDWIHPCPTPYFSPTYRRHRS